jgi:RNA 2',3'-cyclic 3'-phosphodiesterase
MQRVFEVYRDWPISRKREDGLFFALSPDRGLARRIALFGERFIRDHRLDGQSLVADHLHVSLQNVGQYPHLPTKFIYAATKAGDAVVSRPFDLEFDSIMSFAGAPSRDGTPRRRPLVILGRTDALSDLHQALGRAMQTNGLRAAASFLPHMTLHYGPKPVAMQPIEPICFAVREFTLIHSERGCGRHNMLGRWQLRG